MKKDEVHTRCREEEREEQEKVINETANADVDNESKLEDETNEFNDTNVENEEVDEVTQLKEELAKANDRYLRAVAELENFKRRINEERIKDRMYANQSLLEQFINVTDIFDKAVNIKTDDSKLENFLIGFRMINDNIKTILEDEGIKKIQAIGMPFDAKYHMAVETGHDETKEDNIILEEIQTGYIYKERILRPSRVKVNKLQGGNE